MRWLPFIIFYWKEPISIDIHRLNTIVFDRFYIGVIIVYFQYKRMLLIHSSFVDRLILWFGNNSKLLHLFSSLRIYVYIWLGGARVPIAQHWIVGY